jgi:hypothetical protein
MVDCWFTILASRFLMLLLKFIGTSLVLVLEKMSPPLP